jgi:hypothetical protein
MIALAYSEAALSASPTCHSVGSRERRNCTGAHGRSDARWIGFDPIEKFGKACAPNKVAVKLQCMAQMTQSLSQGQSCRG